MRDPGCAPGASTHRRARAGRIPLGRASALVHTNGTRPMPRVGVARLGAGASRGASLPAADPGLGESTVTHAFRSRGPVSSADPQADGHPREALEATVLPGGWRSVCSVPILTEGEPAGVLSSYLAAPHGPTPDHTGRLQALAALGAAALANAEAYERERAALQKLRTLDALKDDFLSTVSHELRTPLTVVEGLATTLRSRWDDLPEAQRQRLVRRVEVQAGELHERIRDLLDFSKLQSRGYRASIQPSRCPIRPLIEDVLGRLEPSLTPHPVDVDAPEGLDGCVDPDAFERILENLLVNAARYSDPDAPILVRARTVGDEGLEVVVADHGIGIPAEERERIFDRFYRGRQAEARRVRGTGIGLAVVKELTELLSGEVRVESSTDPHVRGSTFTVRLPAAPTPAPGATADEGRPPDPRHADAPTTPPGERRG